MEFKLQSSPAKKTNFTIGFLDENLYNEFYSQMMPGIFEAARKCRANIIRFAYYPYHYAYDYTRQVKMILELIAQFELDGLLFLGWARAGALHNSEEFTTRFSSMPLLSIGSGFEDIPYVYSPGNIYIREIILHLIQTHHFKRIAYIAPAMPDNRNETYLELMKEHGIYHPELYVSEQELAGVTFPDRAKRALAILLDERRVTFDAIISMYSEDARNTLNELKLRGFRVPQDIAVTSFEERDIIKYSSPALTTVYFPWIELGYCGCMKLVELLSQGHIPHATEVPGEVIYRNSCGCLSSSIKIAGKVEAPATAGSEGPNGFEGPNGSERPNGSEGPDGSEGPNGFEGPDVVPRTLETITEFEQEKIVAKMEAAFPYTEFDFKILLEAFFADYQTKNNTAFFGELSSQLRAITHSYIHSNIKDLISVFRGALLPYLMNDPGALLWSGNLFQQAQVLTWEKITNVYSSAKVNAKILSQALQEISQILITSFSTENLMDCLAKNLPKLQIPSCYIFLFNSPVDPQQIQKDQFHGCRLAFAYSNNAALSVGPSEQLPFKQIISEMIASREGSSIILAHLLHVTDEFMGFVLFEPGPMDQMLYQTLATHISTALRGAQLFEKLEASYQELAEQAHREGMADISIEILHNIGNILNSINVSASLIKSAADSVWIPYLLNANELLTANLTDLENFIAHDPKGKKLMQFYIKLGMSFTEFKNQVLYNSNRLDDKVHSIVDMISAQQTYAGVKEIIEKLDIASILDDVIKLMAESIEKYQIKITKDYQVRPQIMVQRMKLFHILFKLINNAKEAMAETGTDERKLTFTILEDDQGKYIRISDSGRRIPSNLLEKIFELGYSNQKNGHQLGLHSCTKYMAEMGGKIWAESDGTGQGTAFVLQFSV